MNIVYSLQYRCQSWGPPVFIPRFPGHLYQFHFIVTRAQWWRPPLPRWMSVSARWWPPGKSFRASAGHLSSLDCALFTSNLARISRHCHHGLFQTFLYLQQSTNNFFDSLIVWCVLCITASLSAVFRSQKRTKLLHISGTCPGDGSHYYGCIRFLTCALLDYHIKLRDLQL